MALDQWWWQESEKKINLVASQHLEKQSEVRPDFSGGR